MPKYVMLKRSGHLWWRKTIRVEFDTLYELENGIISRINKGTLLEDDEHTILIRRIGALADELLEPMVE